MKRNNNDSINNNNKKFKTEELSDINDQVLEQIHEYLYEYSSTVNCSDMMVKFFKLKEAKMYVLKMKSILMHLDLCERDLYINRINFLYGIKLHNLRNNK
jgi:hypothetical protein